MTNPVYGRATSRGRRGPVIWLAVFLVISTVVTWLVYVTLRRDVRGPTVGYSALFTDVFGLREGDDVRIAGVRVGRVEDIALDGTLAKVSFVLTGGRPLTRASVASVNYQNVIGQRYLALGPGYGDTTEPLPAGAVIDTAHTVPSFDIGTMLNGYRPLFAVLDPDQVNNLTHAVIGSLQGDTSSIALLVNQTSALTATFAGRDGHLDGVITSLNDLVGILAQQNAAFDRSIAQTATAISGFDSRRPELVEAVGSMRAVTDNLAVIAAGVEPDLRDLVNRRPGYTRHMLDIEPQIAYTGQNMPIFLKGLSRIFGDGAYMNAYACDVNAYGFFPGLNDIVPIIVDAATPGNKAMHSPKCRSMADG